MGKTWIATLALNIALAGCATLPRHVHKIHSEALGDPGATSLGALVATNQGDPNLSGIRLLASGDEALASLVALADHAERTLDIQYYLIQQDDSARILLQHVRQAAIRGVRVRLLVDDLNTAGEDRRFLHLGQLPHVEVRVFNPFYGGRSAMWSRLLSALSEIPRINHRMHNKLFVADNSIAITGGRNIGDQYFVRAKSSNFIDLDVITAGNVVAQLSASFDAFWNSKYAYPIAAVASPVTAEKIRAPLADQADGEADWLAHDLDARNLRLEWVPAQVLADRPQKIAIDSQQEETMAGDIAALMQSAKQELIVISPYFVPGQAGVTLMRELVARGVHVRVLTNSLASTDSPLVHTGYKRYRADLLKAGIDLSEVRPKLGVKRRRFHPFRSSNASLHAKALVIDQTTVFIGSSNMDARSARTNSELGLVFRSEAIAAQVISLLDDISEDGSYKLEWDDARKRIRWESGEPGFVHSWYTDPETTLLQRLALKAFALFSPEELL
jgi:phosphatidylserine/phosphatidylglycerophosphate/cardiolipin synthase-like enzyme